MRFLLHMQVVAFVVLVAYDLYFKREMQQRRARRTASCRRDAKMANISPPPAIGLPSESRVSLRPRRGSERSWRQQLAWRDSGCGANRVGGARGVREGASVGVVRVTPSQPTARKGVAPASSRRRPLRPQLAKNSANAHRAAAPCSEASMPAA